MRRTQVLTFKAVVAIILFYALLLSGCYFFPQEEEVLAPPLKEPEEITYRTIEAKIGNIEKRINATAYFVSDEQTDLFFKYKGGRIESINVKAGDMIEIDDILIQLETDSLETQLLQQEISLEKLILNYNQNISNIERSIYLANIELDELNKKIEKLKKAIASIPEGISIQDIMPNAMDDLESLEDRIKWKEFEIEGEKKRYHNTYDMMELDVKAAELQIDILQSELEKTKLVSPIAGRVVWVTSSKIGEYIYTYSNLVRIADITKLKLRYTGDNVSDFKMEDRVEVKIDDNEYVGVVVMNPSTAPFDADENIKKSVLIDVKGLPSTVKLGDSARISLLLDSKEDVIVIPRDLLHGFMGQKTVYVLEDGIKKDRNVQVGIETSTEVEIVKGLEIGEKIIEN